MAYEIWVQADMCVIKVGPFDIQEKALAAVDNVLTSKAVVWAATGPPWYPNEPNCPHAMPLHTIRRVTVCEQNTAHYSNALPGYIR